MTSWGVVGPAAWGWLRGAAWGRQGSNLRPRDYESPALTTELRPRATGMARGWYRAQSGRTSALPGQSSVAAVVRASGRRRGALRSRGDRGTQYEPRALDSLALRLTRPRVSCVEVHGMAFKCHLHRPVGPRRRGQRPVHGGWLRRRRRLRDDVRRPCRGARSGALNRGAVLSRQIVESPTVRADEDGTHWGDRSRTHRRRRGMASRCSRRRRGAGSVARRAARGQAHCGSCDAAPCHRVPRMQVLSHDAPCARLTSVSTPI